MPVASASSVAAQYGAWAYLAVFVLTALGWAGMPGIGGAVIGGAAVLASQGKLNLAGVLIAAAAGTEAGGLLGYGIGDRWARRFLDRPGGSHDRLRRATAKAQGLYERWGR